MNNKRMLWTLLLLPVALVSKAQEDSTRVTSLNEVVVTATRFPKKVSETGKVVTVISNREIENNNGKDLAQILTEQAGLVVNGAYSNPGKDKSLYLRGAGTDYTVILLNGIPVSDPSGTGGAFDIRMFPVEQIERVEILKGAQSTLYGSDAIAGVINIITKKAVDRPLQAYGGLSVGSYNTFKADAGINGGAEGSTYNIGFVHYKTDGLSEALDTTSGKTFDKDGMLRNSVNADFSTRLAKGLYVKPYFRYSYFKGGYDDGAFADADNKYDAQMLTTGTQVQYNFANGGITAFYDYDEVSRNFTDAYGVYPYNGRKNSIELYGHYFFTPHLQLLAGIHHNKQKVSDEAAIPKNPTAALTSPYLSLFIHNLYGFNLEAGARYNHHSAYGNNFTYSLNPSYTFGNKLKIFANYATAFKAPSLQSLYGPFGSNTSLEPETSVTTEAGFQTTLLSGVLDARAVYFKRTIENVIVYGPSFQLINLNKQNDRGIELEPAIYITKQLTLKLMYAWVDGEVTTKQNGKDSTYANLIRRPKHRFGANIGWQATPHFFLSTQLTSYGKTGDLYYDMATFSQQSTVLSAYTLWNAYASYQFAKDSIKFYLDVKNITSARYVEVYGYSTLGFTLNGGVRIRI